MPTRYVRGHHSNFLDVQPPLLPIRLLVGSFFPSLVTKNEVDQKKMFPVKDRIIKLLRETGYMHIQATKPDTVDGQLTKKFELDDLLNNVMVYWISGSITSSMRLYKETFANYHEMNSYSSVTTSVPTGYASLPHELSFTPEPWLSYIFKNVISYTSFPDGGHFAAFEEPKLMAEDIRKFATGVEDFLLKNPEK
ncbi:Epoxide hydrolase 1 [Holothuria leucospilota]|uniref:Epoxide hydrolase 1 n=1 Tax=Holothuria leucospilota TaxID=206669 RepID=A0A9Q1BAP6_HOLLE|nr:Epoxide hydrolase 1 [Holothuria leucospilota]